MFNKKEDAKKIEKIERMKALEKEAAATYEIALENQLKNEALLDDTINDIMKGWK